MQTTSPRSPTFTIIFELDRTQCCRVNISSLTDGSHTKIVLISSVDFDTTVASTLIHQLMKITPPGLCKGAQGNWYQLGMKLPEEFFHPYLNILTDHLLDGKCFLEVPTETAPVISTFTKGMPPVPRFAPPAPPTLEQVYQNVVTTLRTRGGHPTLSMAGSAATRKLYNHIDSITRRTLTFEENMEICRRLVKEMGRDDYPECPPGIRI